MFIDFWISDQEIEAAAIMQGTNRTAVVNELREVAEQQARRKLNALSVPMMTRADDVTTETGIRQPLTYAEALALMGVSETEFEGVVQEFTLTQISKPQSPEVEAALARIANRVLSDEAAHAAQQEEDRPKFEVLRCGHTEAERCMCTFADALLLRTCDRCDNQQYEDRECPHCPLGCDRYYECYHSGTYYDNADVKE